MKIPVLLGIGAVASYFYPATIAPIVGFPSARLYVAILPAITAYVVLGSRHQPRVRASVAIFVYLTCVAVLTSMEPTHSAMRWMGFAVLVAAVGPLLHNPYIVAFRDATWRVALAVIAALTVVSCVWWMAGLPSYGRGDFSGLWNHSIVLGAFAAVAATWAYVRTIEWRSPLIGAILAISVLTCVLSASRAALLAAAIGILVSSILLLRRRFYFLYAMFFGVLMLGATSYLAYESIDRGLPDHVHTRVLDRGFSTESRERLWNDRLAEFQNSPLVGVGFGVQQTEFEGGRVEPGSSYLALLAQTGVVGAVGFVVFGVVGVVAYWRNRRRLNAFEASLLVGIGVCFLTHQMFEGYLLAVGSPLAFMFWLWAGVSLDRTQYPEPLRRPPAFLPRPALAARMRLPRP